MKFLFVYLVLFLDVYSIAQCKTTPLSNVKGWPKGSTQPVNIDPSFSPAERAGILNAIEKWKQANSSSGNNSQVTFSNPTYNSTPSTSGVQITKTTPANPSVRGDATINPNVYTQQTYGVAIRVRPDVTSQGAVEEVVSHELGHAAGLDECPTCALNESVMAPPPSDATTNPNATGRTSTPTACDNQTVNQNGSYGSPPPPPPPDDSCSMYYANQCRAQVPPCRFDWDMCICTDCGPSPIVINLDGGSFELTSLTDGVTFDIDADGVPQRVSWIAATANVAFLALDRNGNGKIDDGKELFGNFTEQDPSDEPNGFLALARFDVSSAGGNNDSVIDSRDAVFPLLRVWIDSNHNGISEPLELRPLATVGVNSISLEYRESQRRDQYGNRFRFRAKVNLGQAESEKWAYDVFLLSQPAEVTRLGFPKLIWWKLGKY